MIAQFFADSGAKKHRKTRKTEINQSTSEEIRKLHIYFILIRFYLQAKKRYLYILSLKIEHARPIALKQPSAPLRRGRLRRHLF
jgi:hypothetical protein